MDPLNENLRDEYLEEFFRTKEVAFSSAINNPLPFLQGLRNENIITEEEFEKYQKETTSNPDNIGKLVCDLFKKTNNISALKEIFCNRNLEMYPDLKTIFHNMNSGPARGTKRKRRPQRQSRGKSKTICIPRGKKKLDVICGKATGVLYIEKMKEGVSEKCIKASDGTWLKLSEFEVKGGHGNCKSWKRTIRFKGVTLEKFIKKGELPKPPNHRKKKGKTASGPVNQSLQFQSSGATDRRQQKRRVIETSSSSEVSPAASPATPHVSPEEAAAETVEKQEEDEEQPGTSAASAGVPPYVIGARRRRRWRVIETSSSSSEVSPAASPTTPHSWVSASPEEATAETVEEEEEEQQQQLRTSAASAGMLPHARASCQSILHKIREGISKISSNCSNMEVKLQATQSLLYGLQEHLEQALNRSDVQKQMNDIIHYQAKLHTSVGRLLETQSLEEPQL